VIGAAYFSELRKEVSTLSGTEVGQSMGTAQVRRLLAIRVAGDAQGHEPSFAGGGAF